MSWLLPPLPPNFEAAIRDVRGERPESRMAAAATLGRAKDDQRERAVAGLRTLLSDKHHRVRCAALAAFGELAEASVIEEVVACFDDPAPDVREVAALTASQIGGPAAVAALRQALCSPAPEVRFQAVAGLSEMQPAACERDLLPLLDDSDAEVRAQVAAALGCLGHAHLSGHLARLLTDDAASVRIESALALASLGDARGERVLLQALANKERLIEVADALAHLQCKRSCDALAKVALAFFTSPHVRAATGAALVRLGDQRGIVALRRVLTGFRPDARSFAVNLVADLGAVELVPELARLSCRFRGADPFATVEALGRFAGRSEAAKHALERTARRSDALGEAARAALRSARPPEKSQSES